MKTKPELIHELNKLDRQLDREKAHIEADKLLIEFINDINIKETWDRVSKHFWYA